MHSRVIKIITITLVSFFLLSCGTTGQQAPERKEKKVDLVEASDLNVQLAIGYIQRKQYEPARDKLEKAIDQNPDNLVAYKTLAYLYALLGLDEDAQTKYEQALDLKPDDPDLSNSYGAFLCSTGRLKEAQEKFAVAYNNPFYQGQYLAQSNAGSCYTKAGEYKKAEALLRKSLRIEPKVPGSLISMAEVGVKTERYLMARAYIQRYHDVKPASAESLWIQIQAEKALGADKHYLKYARQLISQFPDSDEAGWVEAEAHNEQLRQR